MERNHEIEDFKSLRRVPWNKVKLIGAKPPLRPSHVWSIRTKLQIVDRKRDLALFNLSIDTSFAAAMSSFCVSMTWRQPCRPQQCRVAARGSRQGVPATQAGPYFRQ